MGTPNTTKFNTPDGVRFATVVNGAHVIGDIPPTKEGMEALSELVAVATKRFDDLCRNRDVKTDAEKAYSAFRKRAGGVQWAKLPEAEKADWEAVATSLAGQPRDDAIIDWASRHDIQASLTELQAMVGDARTLHLI